MSGSDLIKKNNGELQKRNSVSDKSVYDIGEYRFVELYSDPLCPLCALSEEQKIRAFELYIELDFDAIAFSKHNPFGVMSPDDVELHFRNHYRPVPKHVSPDTIKGRKLGLQDLVANEDFRLDAYWIALINDLISEISELRARKHSIYATTGEHDQRLERLLNNKERLLFEALDELSRLEANVVHAVDVAFDQMLHLFKQHIVKVLKEYGQREVKMFPVEYRKQVVSMLERFWDDIANMLDISISEARTMIKRQFSSKA